MFGLGGVDNIEGNRGADRVYGNIGDDFLFVAGDATVDGYSNGAGRAFADIDKSPKDVAIPDATP
jgi:hypothetical protein